MRFLLYYNYIYYMRIEGGIFLEKGMYTYTPLRLFHACNQFFKLSHGQGLFFSPDRREEVNIFLKVYAIVELHLIKTTVHLAYF